MTATKTLKQEAALDFPGVSRENFLPNLVDILSGVLRDRVSTQESLINRINASETIELKVVVTAKMLDGSELEIRLIEKNRPLDDEDEYCPALHRHIVFVFRGEGSGYEVSHREMMWQDINEEGKSEQDYSRSLGIKGERWWE